MRKPNWQVIIQTVCPTVDGTYDCDCGNCELTERCEADEGDLEPTTAEKIAALLDALRELGVDVPQWQPIETAPKDEEILTLSFTEEGEPMYHLSLWGNAVKAFVCDYVSENDGMWSKMLYNIVHPTHWMPLPKPPKEADR